VFDVLGRVLGLFGRAIDSKEFKFFLTKEAKYIGALLGLHQALNYIYDTEKVFVVEGPFDLLSFRKVFPNTVSSITAGLYENQYKILNFYARTIITVFDSDTAGKEAAEKALNRWKNVINVNLGYHDPNDCFRSMSFKKYQEYVRRKVSRVLLFT
jgi:DNA primase